MHIFAKFKQLSSESRQLAALYGLLLSVLTVVALEDRGYIRAWRVYASQAALVPYTVTLIEVSADDQGNEVRQKHVEALRSDGARFQSHSRIDRSTGKETLVQSQYLLSNRILVDAIGPIHAKSTRRIEKNDFAIFHLGVIRLPSRKCMKTIDGSDMSSTAGEKLIQFEEVQGIRAARIETQEPAMVSWYALDYGCALVGQEIRFRSPDPTIRDKWIEGKSTKTLASIVGGEPDNALFEIPSGYEEMPPSQRYIKYQQSLTGEAKDSNPDAWALEDKKYFALRP